MFKIISSRIAPENQAVYSHGLILTDYSYLE